MKVHYDHHFTDAHVWHGHTGRGWSVEELVPGILQTPLPIHKMQYSGNDMQREFKNLLQISEREARLLTLHSRFPRIIANSTADHWGQVGTAGTGAIVGWLLQAGVKAVAAGRTVAAPCGVRGWLNPTTEQSCLAVSGRSLPSSPTA